MKAIYWNIVITIIWIAVTVFLWVLVFKWETGSWKFWVLVPIAAVMTKAFYRWATDPMKW